MLFFRMIRNRMTILLVCLTVVQIILLITISSLAHENSHLKQTIQRMAAQVNIPKGKNTTTKILDGKAGKFSPKAVMTNKIPRQFSQAEVSILLLKLSDTNAFERQTQQSEAFVSCCASDME